MTTIIYILIALAVLMIMVTIHEFGHYIVGKILKFKINEFSIGFGPSIFSRKGKNGEIFSIRCIPLGGYCAFEGEDEQSNDENSFDKQAPWKRILVLIAGGLFNIVSGIIFSVMLLTFVGYDLMQIKSTNIAVATNTYNITSSDLIYSIEYFNEEIDENQIIVCKDKLTNNNENYFLITNQDTYLRADYLTQFIYENTNFNRTNNYAYNIQKLSKSNEELPNVDYYNFDGVLYNKNLISDKIDLERIINNELMVDDIIYKVNGKRVGFNIDRQTTTLIKEATIDGDVELVVKRNGDFLTIVTPSHNYKIVSEETTHDSSSLGISLALCKYNFIEALGRSFSFTFEICIAVLQILGQLFTGGVSFSTVGGPVTTIATIAGYSQKSISTIFVLLPLIAANLGVFNLMPIPALDGSKVVFCVVEWIRKKPLNRNVENMIHNIGFFILMGLVLLADLYQVIFANIFKTLFG